jgi:SAM-dependent methyltransferase
MRGATLGRSLRLFRAFLSEQHNPDYFYTALATDSVAQLSVYTDLSDALVIDVGGGPGYFRQAFVDVGARYVPVDSDMHALSTRDIGQPGCPDRIVGNGMSLPFREGVADVCYSSNVLEHVRQPWIMAEEMLRVTRPGGIVFISFTVWLSPWGGHETAPWHYCGGARAARRYRRIYGRDPKNVYGASLFPVSVGQALAWARRTERGQLIGAFPRYHPRWAWGISRVAGVREFLTWNLAMVMRRR